MKIQRKRNNPKSRSDRTVFLDRPQEFLDLLSAPGVRSENGRDHARDPGRPKRAGRWLALAAVFFLVCAWLASASRGRDWVETAKAAWASGDESAEAREVPLPADWLLDRAVADGWAERMGKAEHDEAFRALSRMGEAEPLSGSARRALDILRWITALDADETVRDEEAALSIWGDGARIRDQLAFWEENRREIRELIKELAARDIPEPLAGRVYHRIDRLQTRGYRCLEDIRRLNGEVDALVAAGQPEQLFPVLAEFRKRHPDLAGVDALRSDLEMLAEACRWAREGRVERIRAIRDNHVFVSDRIAREVERMASRERPPASGDGPALSVGKSPAPASAAPVEARVRLTGLEIRRPASGEALSFCFGDSNSGPGRTP
jgi:hypothetical protein